MILVDGVPRRVRYELLTPPERSIHEAILAIEKYPQHGLLVEAICLLAEAKDLIAEYVDRAMEHKAT